MAFKDNKLLHFYRNNCSSSVINFFHSIAWMVYYSAIFKVKIFRQRNCLIKGMSNLNINGSLYIGSDVGFSSSKDLTILNLRGQLHISGSYSIGRGCRIDIGPSAIVKIAGGGYINVFTTLIIMHSLIIGKGCIISWNCQFLDDDFHEVKYENRKVVSEKGISIGDHVWIGCGVKIYKGTTVADGCVVAADSVLRGIYSEKNALIAGNPAKIIKQNILWE